jgi:hypothetical protein
MAEGEVKAGINALIYKKQSLLKSGGFIRSNRLWPFGG